MINDTNEFREWLSDNLADPAAIQAPSCFNAWLNDIDAQGHVEIPGHLSASGNPVTSWWPELTVQLNQ